MLDAADPLVRILEKDVLLTHRHCQAMEDLVLEVHLSHTHGEVKWYKDGEKLQDTGHVRLEEDGVRRSLVILGTTGKDAGEYLCDTGDDSIVFFITVEGEQEVLVGMAWGRGLRGVCGCCQGGARLGWVAVSTGRLVGSTWGVGCTCVVALWKPLHCSAAARGAWTGSGSEIPSTGCFCGDSPSLQSQSHR